jgi:putative modified peptide
MPFNLDERIVDALLDKLSSDDGFRVEFQRDPRAALAAIGHAPAADASVASGIWACCVTKELASKEGIRASRIALRNQLLSAQASLHPITLEAKQQPS